MKEFSEYERIIWLHNQIKSNRFNREEYFHKFGRVQRTLNRDICKLRDYLNAPVKSKNGYYFYSDKTYELPTLLLSEKEMFGLLVSISIIETYKDTPMYTSLYKIFERMKSLLSNDIKYLYLDINNGNSKTRNFNWDFLEQIIKAIFERCPIEIKYHSFSKNKITTRILEPYHVYNYKGEFYMVAYCPVNKEFRDFFIGRIRSLTLINKKFCPRKFLINKYFSDKQWGIIKGGKTVKVVFKITKKKEPWIKERYGYRLKKIRSKDKWSTYELMVIINDELINWIIGYGNNLIILEPKNLIDEIKNTCWKVLGNYR